MSEPDTEPFPFDAADIPEIAQRPGFVPDEVTDNDEPIA